MQSCSFDLRAAIFGRQQPQSVAAVAADLAEATGQTLADFDCGSKLSRESLYLKPAAAPVAAGRALNAAAVPGHTDVPPVDVLPENLPESENRGAASSLQQLTTSARGALAPPLDDSEEKRKLRAERRKNQLDAWFGMKRKELTPELKRELTAINLRGYANRNVFYKSTAFENSKLPNFFQYARVLPGGLEKPVGEDTKIKSTSNVSQRKLGNSMVREFLRDAEVQKWADRKEAEVRAEESSGDRRWYNARRKARTKAIRAAARRHGGRPK